MPVHLGGSAADMDAILAVAAKHKLPVLEDACQAHLAEWQDQKVSTLGDLGCFSFQASKNLNSGEGGAILTNNDDLFEQCKSFQNNGRAHRDGGLLLRAQRGQPADDRVPGRAPARSSSPGSRSNRAAASRTPPISTELLREIPGIAPARMYDGCTRNAYHLYMFRYDPRPVRGPAAVEVPRGACMPREFPAPAATARSTRSRS